MKLLNKYKDSYDPSKVIYIGRGSIWGNPHVIGQHGTRDEVIAQYKIDMIKRVCRRDPIIIDALKGLEEDSEFLCFCFPKPCHGQVIIDIWKEIHQAPTFEEGLKMYIEKHSEKVWNPDRDGIDHVNVYSKGKTGLGRLLTNFAHTPFTMEKYGTFQSVEGFWYWVSTGMKHDRLRELHGFTAKQTGKQYEKCFCEGFEDLIKEAIRCKLEQNSYILDELIHNTLPLTHYYFYGKSPDYKIVQPTQHDWIITFIEDLRRERKEQRSQHH